MKRQGMGILMKEDLLQEARLEQVIAQL